MAERYGLLPSAVLAQGTTLDLFVMDIGMRYEVYKEQKAKGKYKKPVPKLSEEQMLSMIENAKKHKQE
jgi:hypothetical protein